MMNQSFSLDAYEIIVVDNASTDNTKETVDRFNLNSETKIVYTIESRLGLHHARHAGARIAQGHILVFCDDDIAASHGWLDAISQSFSEENVGLVTGKILPLYEEKPPEWLNFLWTETHYGRSLGFLSLLDLGDNIKEIPPTYCYGCNFAIKKTILYECHGFNPDGVPQENIRFRGDGETSLARIVSKKNYRIIYTPQALIRHLVPKQRMTMDYICKRAFNQGVSDSYSRIRRHGKVTRLFEIGNMLRLSKRILKKLLIGSKKEPFMDYLRLHYQLEIFYQRGWHFHQHQVRNNRNLLEYVLRPSYLQID